MKEDNNVRKDFKDCSLDYRTGGSLKERWYMKDIVLYFIKNDADVRNEIASILSDVITVNQAAKDLLKSKNK
jgi:hypothetical protein